MIDLVTPPDVEADSDEAEDEEDAENDSLLPHFLVTQLNHIVVVLILSHSRLHSQALVDSLRYAR